MKQIVWATLACLVALVVIVTQTNWVTQALQEDQKGLVVVSSSFLHEQIIPDRYAYDFDNYSPQISWTGVPQDTKSFTIICHDPDAPFPGGWTHWLFYNIPAECTSLDEHVKAVEFPEIGGIQGYNDFKQLGYGGPKPPSGTHRYFFYVYALDIVLAFSEPVTKALLEEAMHGHVLARGVLMGKYRAR